MKKMGSYIETLRSTVPAWEIDIVEHFTVAYYFERFARAGARLLIEAGYDPGEPGAPRTLDCHTRYLRELRAGDQFHIESAVLNRAPEGDAGWIVGHKLYDSTTAELCTTLEQTFSGQPKHEMSACTVDWDGPARENRPEVTDAAMWVHTGTDVLRPTEMDWAGKLDLSGFIHRFTSASEHLQTMFGMSGQYMRENRIGFSTFEFNLTFPNAAPTAGEIVNTRSAVAHVGRTSFRLVHEMIRPSTAEVVATLSLMGVHLDLDARRPKPIPDDIRARAVEMLAPTT